MEIIDSARLTLGYIYFELSSYATALKYLRSISPDFYEYPEVLLAIGWSAFKLREYDSVLQALNNLAKSYPDYYNLEEVHFLMGQCYLKLGYYDFAISNYNQIIMSKAKPVDYQKALEEFRSEISSHEKQLEDLNTELLVLEAKLVKSEIATVNNGTEIFSTDPVVKKDREALVASVQKERRDFQRMNRSLRSLKKQLGKGEILQNWQAYAEYGKARALYLKSVGRVDNN